MPRYYEFDIALQEIQPRIWRRLLIRTTSTFAQLHKAIQESFGWENSPPPFAGLPGGEECDRPTPDARQLKRCVCDGMPERMWEHVAAFSMRVVPQYPPGAERHDGEDDAIR